MSMGDILEAFQNILNLLNKTEQVSRSLPEFSHHFSRDLECPKTEMYSFEPGAKLQPSKQQAGDDLKGLDKKGWKKALY